MDIDTYLDYAAVQIFIQNHDWPGNNVRLWRLNLPRTIRMRLLAMMGCGAG